MTSRALGRNQVRPSGFRPRTEPYVLIRQLDSLCLQQFCGAITSAAGRRAAFAAPHGPADQRAPPPASKSLAGLSGRESGPFTTGHIRLRWLQSQPLSLSYRSLLPTSLTYFGLESRDCSPWGPDADIGTVCRAGRARDAPTLFKGPLDQQTRARIGPLSGAPQAEIGA